MPLRAAPPLQLLGRRAAAARDDGDGPVARALVVARHRRRRAGRLVGVVAERASRVRALCGRRRLGHQGRADGGAWRLVLRGRRSRAARAHGPRPAPRQPDGRRLAAAAAAERMCRRSCAALLGRLGAAAAASSPRRRTRRATAGAGGRGREALPQRAGFCNLEEEGVLLGRGPLDAEGVLHRCVVVPPADLRSRLSRPALALPLVEVDLHRGGADS
mmetsp:Transcript_36440/g.117726  ORF Transcript_36440/g.117726 Transcript_36440/m.117726 type:complete len:217 (+) Transcript_36440:1643-2293(+)